MWQGSDRAPNKQAHAPRISGKCTFSRVAVAVSVSVQSGDTSIRDQMRPCSGGRCASVARLRSSQRGTRQAMYNDSLFNAFAPWFEARRQTDRPTAEYLESCRGDPMRCANAAERILAAIGEPQMIDTAKDPRLGRIFLNRTIRSYPAFAGFHGMEETIE